MEELTNGAHKKLVSRGAWTIKASYNDDKRMGWFRVEDMETGIEVIRKVPIKGIASVSIITFLAIQLVVSYCDENSFFPEIYCSNKAAFEWYMQGECDSKKYDKDILRMIVYCELLTQELERPGRVICSEFDGFNRVKIGSHLN